MSRETARDPLLKFGLFHSLLNRSGRSHAPTRLPPKSDHELAAGRRRFRGNLRAALDEAKLTNQSRRALSAARPSRELDDSIESTIETRREDVPNWDSLSYINFVVASKLNSA
jgi:hypothetical protein